jgi:hypothetical protein
MIFARAPAPPEVAIGSVAVCFQQNGGFIAPKQIVTEILRDINDELNLPAR